MRHAERWHIEFGTLSLMLAMSLVSSRASAWCQMTSDSKTRPSSAMPCVLPHGWIGNVRPTFFLRWNQPCTAISLSSALPSSTLPEPDVRAAVQRCIDTWLGTECEGGARLPLSVELLAASNACTEARYYRRGANVNSIMFVREGWLERGHDARAFAVTLVWHNAGSGEIWDADMEINEARGPFAICPTEGCSPGSVDLENVVTHELGHYFGIAHTPDDELATMWASAQEDEVIKRDLQPDDIQGICTVYGTHALLAECDPASRGGLGLECVPPPLSCAMGRAQHSFSPWVVVVALLSLRCWRRS